MFFALSFALSLALFLPVAVPMVDLAAQDSDSFEKGLASVERSMDKGRWEKAQESLKDLLAANERAEYAYLEKPRILQNMERIALFQQYSPPTANDVLAGKVKKYDAKTGKIEVTFVGSDLSDFSENGGAYTLPVSFSGPYSIEMSGERYPIGSSLSIVIGWTTDHEWQVSFGSKQYKPTIAWLKGDDDTEFLETSEKQPLERGKPYQLLIEVKGNKVTAKTNKKKLFSLKRPKGDYGRAAFFGLRDYELESLKIVIKGELETSWIAGKVDEVMQERLLAFEKTYAPERELPAWLFEDFTVKKEAEKESTSLRGSMKDAPAKEEARQYFRPYPGDKMNPDGLRVFTEILKELWMDDSGMEEVLAMIDESVAGESADLTAAAADYLRMEVLLIYGMVEDAAAPGARVLEADSEHRPAVLLYVNILRRMRNFDGARRILADARENWPASEEVINAQIELEVYAQQLETAQDLIRDARSSKEFIGDASEELQGQIDKAVSGPHWPKTYSFKSKHYVIESDISESLCKEAGNLLESAYTSYSVRLKRIKNLEKERFRVFIFSGEASYKRYAQDSFGATMENTAGLYSPFLKQLLIWNVPQREDMFRTVIHEGFHQYLDAASFGAPIWFNEGMAEYNERAKVKNGRWTMGQGRPDHLDTLERNEMLNLEDLIWISRARFQQTNVSLHYAQSWAFIHFLRNSGKKEQKIFDALFKGFVESPSSGRVIADVFEDVDFDDLNVRFVIYLEKLRSK